jgi:stress-induced-phosphoprotein 1
VELKNKGNDAYKHKKFEEALSLYEQAIQINPDEPLYYNNKTAVYIELKQFESALGEVIIS